MLEYKMNNHITLGPGKIRDIDSHLQDLYDDIKRCGDINETLRRRNLQYQQREDHFRKKYIESKRREDLLREKYVLLEQKNFSIGEELSALAEKHYDYQSRAKSRAYILIWLQIIMLCNIFIAYTST
jgi:hypothetical protein